MPLRPPCRDTDAHQVNRSRLSNHLSVEFKREIRLFGHKIDCELKSRRVVASDIEPTRRRDKRGPIRSAHRVPRAPEHVQLPADCLRLVAQNENAFQWASIPSRRLGAAQIGARRCGSDTGESRRH